MTLFIIDDTFIQEFFKCDRDAKLIFSYFQQKNYIVLIASNVYKKLLGNPKLKGNIHFKLAFEKVVKSFGSDEVYGSFSFEKATSNIVNIHSDFNNNSWI